VAIGVSYYVFQAISYLVDIYLEIEKPEHHFGYFALYLAFFPKLLQGPIERAGDLIPQLKARYEFNYDNMRFGMLLFTWGLFKKVVIADRLSLYVDAVYNDVHAFTGLPLLLATYAYAFQIYMDFSGYTDMALGSARLFNINLTQNFNSPYLATSVIDFWRRWHISFSRWILDYIFKPLQMQWRNWKNLGTAAALIATFLISGIWHGASWGFVIWGGLHGLYMACSIFYKPYQKKLHKALGIEKTNFLEVWQIFVTFNLVIFAWVFFRAKSIPDALHIVTHLHTGVGKISDFPYLSGKIELLITIITLSIVLLVDCRSRTEKFEQTFFQKSALQRWSVYFVLALSIISLAIDCDNLFIYTQF
jgi:D-alanyl-lipoteichoic acid acyltransferase DltB (MBOAT superfamily)